MKTTRSMPLFLFFLAVTLTHLITSVLFMYVDFNVELDLDQTPKATTEETQGLFITTGMDNK